MRTVQLLGSENGWIKQTNHTLVHDFEADFLFLFIVVHISSLVCNYRLIIAYDFIVLGT